MSDLCRFIVLYRDVYAEGHHWQMMVYITLENDVVGDIIRSCNQGCKKASYSIQPCICHRQPCFHFNAVRFSPKPILVTSLWRNAITYIIYANNCVNCRSVIPPHSFQCEGNKMQRGENVVNCILFVDWKQQQRWISIIVSGLHSIPNSTRFHFYQNFSISLPVIVLPKLMWVQSWHLCTYLSCICCHSSQLKLLKCITSDLPG